MPAISESAMTGDRLAAGKRREVVARLAKYFFSYKWRVLTAFFLMLGSNAFALIGPWLSGLAVDAIALEGGVDFAAVSRCCALMAVFYVVSSAFSYVLSVLMIRLSQNIVRSMRQDVFDKILRLPVSLMDGMQAGDLINRISYDIDTVNASLSNDILQAATSVVTVAGAFVGMALASPVMLCVLLVTIPVAVVITVVRSRTVRPLFRKRSAKLAELNGFSEEMLSGLKTIKAYGEEPTVIEKFCAKNTDAVDAYYASDYYGSLIGPAVNFVNNLGMALISTAGAFLYLYGFVSPGGISSFLLYSRRFSGPINEYANIMGEIQSALAAAERVFRLLDSPEEAADAENAAELTDVRGAVAFEHVRFSYDGETEVIRDLSFSVSPGQTAAIVGPTGAGKTTLVNLMMRFRLRAFMARIAATALRSMQGICTSPAMGSHVSPRWCSMAISAAASIWSSPISKSSASAPAAIEHAEPISAWHPHSAPLMEAFVLITSPISPPAASARTICSSVNPRVSCM